MSMTVFFQVVQPYLAKIDVRLFCTRMTHITQRLAWCLNDPYANASCLKESYLKIEPFSTIIDTTNFLESFSLHESVFFKHSAQIYASQCLYPLNKKTDQPPPQRLTDQLA